MMQDHHHYQLGKTIVDHVRSGASDDSPLWAEHYAPDFESVEADGQSWKGVEQVRDKHAEWQKTVTMHGCEVEGPFCGPSGFSVRYEIDAESKDGSWPRMTMLEVGHYTVKDGKIVREEFQVIPMQGQS